MSKRSGFDKNHDARWSGPAGDVLVEIKRSSNARDVRDVLIGLAYALNQEPASSQALCLLGRSRLTPLRLQEEVKQFRGIVHPKLANRISLASVTAEGHIQGEIPQDGPSLRSYLANRTHLELKAGGDRVSRETVRAHLVHLWISGHGPLSQAQLSRRTKASAPTVAATLRELEQRNLLSTTPAGVMLWEPSWEAWKRLIEAHGAKRTTITYTDPSRLPYPPLELVKRLHELQRRGIATSVAIGGVVGATYYDPNFDLTAPPRLDLCVYDGNTDFMAKLDAGLQVTTDLKAKAIVVVHQVQSDFGCATDPHGLRIASPMDCLADVLECGLSAQAKDLAMFFNRHVLGRNT